MPTVDNYDDLFKMLRNNDLVNEQMVGQTVTQICPVCSKEVEFEILEEGKAICPSCKNEIHIEFNVENN